MLEFLLIRFLKWTVIVVGIVLDVGENLKAFLIQPPALEISVSTTRITEPLARDGLPDYFQAMIDLGPKGIEAENNAAAAVWGVIPSKQSSDNAIDHSPARLSADDQRPTSERLVMPPPPPDGMDAAKAVTAAPLHSPAPERNSCRTGTVTLCPPSATKVTLPGAYSAATTLPKPSGTRDTPWM